MKIHGLILFILFSSLYGENGLLTGNVTDDTNNSPLIGANVILEGTSLGAATDDKGKYEIKNIPTGNYTITVSYIGFRKFREEIEIKSGEKNIKDLALQPEAIEMETYVVTASRRRERVEDAPAAISVISKTEIDLMFDILDDAVAEIDKHLQ